MSSQERTEILLKAPPRTWIALSDDESRVVAYAPSYEEAVEKAEASGESDPILIMTPDSWQHMVLAQWV